MEKFIGFLLRRSERKDFREVVNELTGIELEDEVEIYCNEKLKNLTIQNVVFSAAEVCTCIGCAEVHHMNGRFICGACNRPLVQT